MIFRFKTKRNMNGNIKYIAFDTEKREFSRMYSLISNAGEAIEIKSKDFNKIRDEMISGNYTEVSSM